MKKGWDRYAIEKRYIKKGYLRKYRNGNPSWKAQEAGNSDSIQQSREGQKEEIKEYSYCNGHQFNAEDSTHSVMGGHACPYCPLNKYMIPIIKQEIFIGDDDESIRKKDVGETHSEGRQGVPESDQGRCEAEEKNTLKIKGEKMKKQSAKERKHEAKETKAYEKKEDKKEKKRAK